MASKKDKIALRKDVEKTLMHSFSSIKETVGDKKFAKKVKKASKILIAGAKIKHDKKAPGKLDEDQPE